MQSIRAGLSDTEQKIILSDLSIVERNKIWMPGWIHMNSGN